MTTTALVVAAGKGVRLGSPLPKALVSVQGISLLGHAVTRIVEAQCVDYITVTAPPSYVDKIRSILAVEVTAATRIDVIEGGLHRQVSVRLALDHALNNNPSTNVVLVHDAARAFAPPELIKSVVDLVVQGNPAVIPALAATDTIKQVDSAGYVIKTLDRSQLCMTQTPQGFSATVLQQAHQLDRAANGHTATDDAALVERLGIAVLTIPGHSDARKITTIDDLRIATAHASGAAS